MPVIQAFQIPKLYMFIPSGDHMPPHFHIRHPDGWVIKIDITACTESTLSFVVIRPPQFAGPNSKLEKTIRQNVVEHRAALLQEFEDALPKKFEDALPKLM